MITVRLPSALRQADHDTLHIDAPVATIGELVAMLDHLIPGFAHQMDDALFNFAVNDEMVLHGASQRTLQDGDVVELVPTIAGG
jgi:molybdopterin converting factor small subunit